MSINKPYNNPIAHRPYGDYWLGSRSRLRQAIGLVATVPEDDGGDKLVKAIGYCSYQNISLVSDNILA